MYVCERFATIVNVDDDCYSCGPSFCSPLRYRVQLLRPMTGSELSSCDARWIYFSTNSNPSHLEWIFQSLPRLYILIYDFLSLILSLSAAWRHFFLFRTARSFYNSLHSACTYRSPYIRFTYYYICVYRTQMREAVAFAI